MTFERLKRRLLGTPLASHREKHERLNIPLALAVFASDALSSTAYATEEILIALVGSGFLLQANLLSLPVAVGIVLLLTIVVISYRQVIRGYPQGGGAYKVAQDCLGMNASLVAASALLIDYILTVAVSITAGVAALTSTGYVPQSYSVLLSIGFVIIMTYVNLRGVRESGKVLAFPAYVFIGAMYMLIAYGLWRLSAGQVIVDASPLTQQPATDINWTSIVIILGLLKAFSHGCAALTGIEAISNGVKAFREPVVLNANRTMVIMGSILGSIFIGVTYLAYCYHIVPKEGETIISQIARAVFSGENPFYFLIQISTMVILVLAANTSFAGFPRLASLLADDGFLPRQLMSLGDKLVFSNGILVLGLTSSMLIIGYHADTHALIPLYAVGVFLSFTLAQAGMVKHHEREKKPGWRTGILINGLGAFVTGLVTMLLTVEKFTEGAWIVIVAIPFMIWMFRSISGHYRSVGKQLALPETGYCPIPFEHTVLVLVSSLNQGTIPALEYAKSISTRVEAVHVELKHEATERLRKQWDEWGCGIPLTILKSPYRSITEPILNYIDEVEARYDHDIVTIIIPEFVTKKFWHNILHNQTSLLIKALLRFKKGKVVTTVRFYLDE